MDKAKLKVSRLSYILGGERGAGAALYNRRPAIGSPNTFRSENPWMVFLSGSRYTPRRREPRHSYFITAASDRTRVIMSTNSCDR